MKKIVFATTLAALFFGASSANAQTLVSDPSVRHSEATPFTGFYAGMKYASVSGDQRYLPVYPGNTNTILKGSLFGLEGGWNYKLGPFVLGAFGEGMFGSVSGSEHFDYGDGSSNTNGVDLKAVVSGGLKVGVPFDLFGVELMPFGSAKYTGSLIERTYQYKDSNPLYNFSSTSSMFGAGLNWSFGLEAAVSKHLSIAAEYGSQNMMLSSGRDHLGNTWGDESNTKVLWLSLKYYPH